MQIIEIRLFNRENNQKEKCNVEIRELIKIIESG